MIRGLRRSVVGVVCGLFCLAPLHAVNAQAVHQLRGTVTWAAPTTNVDGNPIGDDLAAYDLCFRFAPLPAGADSANFDTDCSVKVMGVAANSTSRPAVIESSTATGTLYVYVVARDHTQQRSPYSVAGSAAFDIDAAPGAPGAVTLVITTVITTTTSP